MEAQLQKTESSARHGSAHCTRRAAYRADPPRVHERICSPRRLTSKAGLVTSAAIAESDVSSFCFCFAEADCWCLKHRQSHITDPAATKPPNLDSWERWSVENNIMFQKHVRRGPCPRLQNLVHIHCPQGTERSGHMTNRVGLYL